MKALSLCLLLAAPVFGGHQETSPAPTVVYTEFQQDPPPAVGDALQDEVNSIMAPMGRRVTWHALPPGYSSDDWAELALVTFKGRCDVAGLTPQISNPGALGWTYLVNGVILPFVTVDCQGIRGFIQKELLTMPAGDREEAYGRALGRVFAHELYHVLANTAAHTSSGVGESRFTIQELLAPKFRFEGHGSLP